MFWWEENRQRYDEELTAFTRREASFVIDAEKRASGSLALTVNWPLDGGVLELEVRYPHYFPFFRPAVATSGLSLRYHQAPYTGDLCLLPQMTGAWRPQDLAADFIAEQLPKVIAGGSSEIKDDVHHMEVHQAEPRSGYYSYAPGSYLLIDGDWQIPPSSDSGILLVGTGGKGSLPAAELIRSGLRGAVLEVQDQAGRSIVSLGTALASRFEGATFKAHWVRLSAAPEGKDENCFWQALEREFPKVFAEAARKSGKNGEGVVGFLFAEEASYRGASSDGWVFLNFFGANKKGNPRTRIYLSRAERAGSKDLFSRVPELSPLRTKTIAFAGLGCIGAQSAVEFAKSGIGELRFLEGDIVSAGNSCRWPLGAPYYSAHKINALSNFLMANFPYTSIGPCFPLVLGNPFNPPEEKVLLENWLNGADLVFDASAEVGVQHLLSTLAREKQIPYVLIETRPGGWGGVIARIIPGGTGCYYCLCHHFTDGAVGKEGGFKLPPQKKDDFHQPQGCLSPTFTAASFDVEEVSLLGVRMAVSLLCSGEAAAYPYFQDDVAVLSLRDEAGESVRFPQWKGYTLTMHPTCDCGNES